MNENQKTPQIASAYVAILPTEAGGNYAKLAEDEHFQYESPQIHVNVGGRVAIIENSGSVTIISKTKSVVVAPKSLAMEDGVYIILNVGNVSNMYGRLKISALARDLSLKVVHSGVVAEVPFNKRSPALKALYELGDRMTGVSKPPAMGSGLSETMSALLNDAARGLLDKHLPQSGN